MGATGGVAGAPVSAPWPLQPLPAAPRRRPAARPACPGSPPALRARRPPPPARRPARAAAPPAPRPCAAHAGSAATSGARAQQCSADTRTVWRFSSISACPRGTGGLCRTLARGGLDVECRLPRVPGSYLKVLPQHSGPGGKGVLHGRHLCRVRLPQLLDVGRRRLGPPARVAARRRRWQRTPRRRQAGSACRADCARQRS